MERREVAESALKHLCERIGVEYSTESSDPVEGAWFLSTITRGRVNIYAWSNGGRVNGMGVSRPLGSCGDNLTHEEVYDRCWFADRCFTARSEAISVGCAKCGATDLPVIGHADVCGK